MFYVPLVQKQKQKSTFSQACFFFSSPSRSPSPLPRFFCLLPSANSYPIFLSPSAGQINRAAGWDVKGGSWPSMSSLSPSPSRIGEMTGRGVGIKVLSGYCVYLALRLILSLSGWIERIGAAAYACLHSLKSLNFKALLQRYCLANILADGSDHISKSTQPFWSFTDRKNHLVVTI